MKTGYQHIIFPTDFSSNARNAFFFAAEIARKSGAKLTIFHASSSSMDITPNYRQSRILEIDEISNKFDDRISEIREQEKFRNLNISTIIQSGIAVTSLLEYVEEVEPDLIVMGTKGATGNAKMLIGSVATNVIKNSQIPVITIPTGSVFDSFRSIVLTTDFKENDIEALKRLITFAKLFKARINILHIAEKGNLENDIKFRGFRELVKETFSYSNIDFLMIHEPQIFLATINYSLEISASLLAIIRYKKTFWENVSERNYSREMTFYSRIPVMIIPATKEKSETEVTKEKAPKI